MISDKDKLEALKAEAIKKGWTGGKEFNWSGDWMGQPPKLEIIAPFGHHPRLKYTTGGVNVEERFYPPEVMLFDSRFNKALFGKEDEGNPNLVSYPAHRAWEEPEQIPYFEYQMQRAITASNSIDYLYQAVFGEEK